MNLTEKVAFLKGLVAGLELDSNSKETKIISAIIDVLDDLAFTVSDLDEEASMISEHVDAIDEDLEELEEAFFEIFEDDCDCCHGEFDDDFFEIECPACNEVVCFDDSILDENEELSCPNCGAIFEEISFEEDEIDE